MRLLAIAALLGAVLLPAPAQPAGGTKPAPLAVVVSALLAHAADNFQSLRLGRTDQDADFASYASRKVAGHCSACTIRDDYARAAYPEQWTLHDYWKSDKGSKIAANEAYVKSVLTPVLRGYTLHRTVSKYGKYPTLLWAGAHNVWVRVAFGDSGYGLEVGHDLAKPQHAMRVPTSAQYGRLGNAFTALVRAATGAASQNFETLRGKPAGKDIVGDDTYAVSASFGPLFRHCAISNVVNSLGYKDFQPKWTLSCSTAAMATTAETVKPLLRDSVESGLPEGYTQITDANALLFDDYRWDDADAMTSVGISCQENRGTVRSVITIYHFLQKK